jgi:hypothetical protein
MIIDNKKYRDFLFTLETLLLFLKKINYVFGDYFKYFNSTVQFLNTLQVTAWYIEYIYK